MDGSERPKAGSRPIGDRPNATLDGNGSLEAPAGMESAMDYRALLERIPAVTYVAGFGEAGRWDYVSPQIESLLGFSAAEWLSDPESWFRQIHPDDRGRALEEELVSKAGGTPLLSEYRIHRRDGQVVWVRDEAVLVQDAEGRPLYWQGFMVDITSRKTTEQALESSEARHRQLVDNLPVGIYRTTAEGGLLEANRALARILGFGDRASLLAPTSGNLSWIRPTAKCGWPRSLPRGSSATSRFSSCTSSRERPIRERATSRMIRPNRSR